jgi:hypothetical protein
MAKTKISSERNRRQRVINELFENATRRCSICQQPFVGYGNNPDPVNDGVCCNDCNDNVVIPARLALYRARQSGGAN